ncbi:hypothetical protein Tco_0369266 [Tanacetum coccineum]
MEQCVAAIEKGGLEFKPFCALNRSLIDEMVLEILYQNDSFMEGIIIDIINEVRKLKDQGINMRDFMYIKVGNGETTKFWDDIWIGSKPLKLLFPRIYALDNIKDASICMKLNEPSLDNNFRRSIRGGIEQSQFKKLTDLLIPIVLNPCPDRWFWSLEGSGEFSVASIRRFIDDQRLLTVDSKTLWIKSVPIKVNILAWKIKLEALPTRFNISRRDKNAGRSQAKDTFWYQVLNEFNHLNFQKRTKDMLSSKWNSLNHNCQKFNAIYKRYSRLTKSGESELDVMKQAPAAYCDENKNTPFTQEDAWELLRKHSKWDAPPPAPVDLTEDEEIPVVNTDELFGPDARPRPPGKQRPGKKTKSDTSVSTRGSSSSSQFEDIMTKVLRLKREAAKAAFKVAKEKDRTVMRLEEMKFLAISTKDLSEDDAYFIEEQKKVIRAKYNLYRNPGSNPGGSR